MSCASLNSPSSGNSSASATSVWTSVPAVGDLEAAVEEQPGRRQVFSLVRAERGREQVLDRPIAQCTRPVVDRTELCAVSIRLLEVVGEDLLVFGHPVASRLGEPIGETFV